MRFLLAAAMGIIVSVAAAAPYAGRPFGDSRHPAAAQAIPGKLYCAYYDAGGEGVAYHDSDPQNRGSGGLNPLDGTYLNEFRKDEGVDTSYTKFHDSIDNSPYDRVQPREGLLYVGWTAPGEWLRYTVEVAQSREYSVDLLYTSNRGGAVALELDGVPIGGPVPVPTTYDARDPVAWRQWHHWALARAVARVRLPAGRHVLTLRIAEKGNMNLATLDFR